MQNARLLFEDARVRPDRADRLRSLVDMLFRRRHVRRYRAFDQVPHRRELVYYLRQYSQVYRALSTDREGPIPFALGFLRVHPDGRLDTVADRVGEADPEVMARLLSEFMEPGAVLRCEDEDGEAVSFSLRGEDDVERMSA